MTMMYKDINEQLTQTHQQHLDGQTADEILYADDTALISTSGRRINKVLHYIEAIGQDYGMH